MKRAISTLAVLIAAGALTGCTGVSDEDRNEVQSAIVSELIPDTILTSAVNGDEAALEFVDQMHDLAEDMASSIIDEGMCDSPAYRSGLGNSDAASAHDAGCAAAERLGID